jgi:tetratricopeptide (TPR) repeat protein
MISRPFSRLFLIPALLVLANISFAAGDDLKEATRLYQQGQTTQALEQVNVYLASKPRDAQARFLKGVILTDQKKTEEAIKVFTGLTEDFPELPEPYNNLAVLYASLGQYDRAKTALELAIRTHPSYATAHENLGDIYAQLASRAYDKALQLDKTNTTAQTKLSMIKEIFAGKTTRVATKPEAAKPEPAKTETAKAEPAKPAAASAQDAPAQQIVTVAAPKVTRADRNQVIATIQSWAKAWSKKDAQAYLAFYAPDFETPEGMSREDWEKQRTERLQNPKFIQVVILKPSVTLSAPNEAIVVFRQNYRSNTIKSSGSKTLQLVKAGDKWLIKSEKAGS